MHGYASQLQPLGFLRAERELLPPTLTLLGMEPSPAGRGDFGGASEPPPICHNQQSPTPTWLRTCEEGLHELTVGHFHDGPPRVGRERWISTVRQ